MSILGLQSVRNDTHTTCRESVALEEPAAFFPVLNAVTDPDAKILQRTSSKDIHQHIFNAALALDFLAQPGAYAAAEMHLALHAASPKLEAFYQYYNDHHAERSDAAGSQECGSWVDWYGEVVCDVQTLSRLVETQALDSPEEQNRYVSTASFTPGSHNPRAWQDIR